MSTTTAAELLELQQANRVVADVERERRLVRLRASLFAARDREVRFGLPSVSRAELDGAKVRQSLASSGALHVRGLLEPGRVAQLVAVIDAALTAQSAGLAGAEPARTLPWFDLSDLVKGGMNSRELVIKTSSVLAVDSPRGLYQLLEVFYEAGVDRLVTEYFGERPALSAEKTTLRRVEPGELGGWHQDGSFLGTAIRSLNVWVALSDCGEDAPGLELVPARLRRILPTGTEGAPIAFCVAPQIVEREFPGAVIRPRFQAGDALFFDHFLLHRTWRHPGLTRPRYAIESWFFAPSAYPETQTGLYI